MISLKNLLNGLSFLITIILLIYGFVKGYTFIELTLYNLYFVMQIIVQILNILNSGEKKENG